MTSPFRRALLASVALVPLLASRSPTQSAPPRAAAFDLAELTGKLVGSGHAWLPFLDRRSLACGVYRLPKGAADNQPVHDLDEIYSVVAGRATLDVDGTRFAASPGQVLFVAAGAPHRFVDIEEDLTVLVVFSASRPTRGGMAAGPTPTEQTPYDEGSERGSARIFYWFADASAGQVDIGYGSPAWQPSFDAFVAKPTGRRWRFGENFWTTLDTNIPLTIGGAELAVGQYYLVLQNDPEAGLRLLALDPGPVRAQRLDAYEANETTGGIPIPLRHRTVSTNASRLRIDLTVDRAQKDHAALTIRFGPHVLEADVVLHP